jgi:hypothetical protein
MSLKFGFGASAGHFLFNTSIKLGGVILTTGFLRAAYVELNQQSGTIPEDGRGLAKNTLIYSGKNVKDAVQFAIDLNEQTKTSP